MLRLLIADVLPGVVLLRPPAVEHRFGQRARLVGEGQRGRQLEGMRTVTAFYVTDPHRAVDRRTAERRFAAGKQFTGCPLEDTFGTRVEEMAGNTKEHIGDTGKTVGRIDLRQHRRRRVTRPVDRAFGLLHQWPQTTLHRRIAVVEWRRHESAGGKSGHRPEYAPCCRLGHFVAVEAGFLRDAQRKALLGPDRPGVHFRFCLQHGNTPFRCLFLNGPVECRRAAIADDPGVHDQAGVLLPDRLGNRPPQIGSDDEIRPEQRHRLFRHRIGDVELDGNEMAALAQLAIEPLRQAVEGVGQEQYAHFALSGSMPCGFFRSGRNIAVADIARLRAPRANQMHTSITFV